MSVLHFIRDGVKVAHKIAISMADVHHWLVLEIKESSLLHSLSDSWFIWKIWEFHLLVRPYWHWKTAVCDTLYYSDQRDFQVVFLSLPFAVFLSFSKGFFWEIFSMYQLWLTGRSIWKSGMSWRHRDVAPSAFRTLGLKAGTTSTWQFNFFFRFFLFSFGLVVLISIF